MHAQWYVAGMPVLVNFLSYLSPKSGEEEAPFIHLLPRCKGRWCFKVKGRMFLMVFPLSSKISKIIWYLPSGFLNS